MITEDELNKLKDEIREEIVSGLSISLNSTSWGTSEFRSHEVSVELLLDYSVISSSTVTLD